MTLDEFNKKWASSNDQELNEWIAVEIMHLEKAAEGWSRKGLLNPQFRPDAPNFLESPDTIQVLAEIGFNYELLVHYDIEMDLLCGQIGSKLLTPEKRILYECIESTFDRAACKVSLMLALHLDCLVDEFVDSKTY